MAPAFTPRLFLLLVLLGGLTGVTWAQDTLWARRYNGTGNSEDIPTAMVLDSAGNVYVTGQSYGPGFSGYDFLTIKYSSQGDTLWIRRWNNPSNSDDIPLAIALDRWGNAYVTGWANLGGINYNYETLKYRPNGDTAWTRSYDGTSQNEDRSLALVLDSGENPVVTGRSYVIGAYASFDIVTLKYDTSGTLLWSADYDSPDHGFEQPASLIRDDSDQIYITGTSSSITTGYDYITLKYSPQLQLLWARRYLGIGGNRDDIVQKIVQGPSRNLYVSGYSMNDSLGYCFATIKYSPAGDTLWVRRYHYPYTRNNYVTAMTLDRDENVLITGYAIWPGSVPYSDFLTVKYDSSGNLLWARLYNGPYSGNDQASALAVDPQGNVLVTGWSQGTTGDNDYATLCYDPGGTQRWVVRYDDGFQGDDKAYALALDPQGRVYVTGGSWGIGTGTDYLTIKYLPPNGVELADRAVKRGVELEVWPNPMHGQCEVRSLSPVRIYDILGRKVRELSLKASGSMVWDGRTEAGVPAPPGVYLFRTREGASRAVTLLR